MKFALTAGFFNRRVAGAESNASGRLKFRERRKAAATTAPNIDRIKRPGQAASVDLRAVRNLVPSQGQVPRPGPVVQVQGASVQAPQSVQSMATSATVATPQLSLQERLAQAEGSKKGLLGLQASWKAASALARKPGASAGQLRGAALAREALVQACGQLRTRLYELEKAHPDIDGQNDDGKRLYMLKVLHIGCAIETCLPGVFSDENEGLDGKLGENVIESLMALDARMTAVAGPAYRLDKLIALLADHGRIREWAAGDAGQQNLALEGLHAIVQTMLDSVGPGRDGTELNAFFGLDAGAGAMDPGLDGPLKALRVQATMDAILLPMAEGNNTTVARLGQPIKDQARVDATALVEREFAIAKAHQRIRRALELAGLEKDIGTLAGLRVDGALAKALRKLGATGAEIGVIIGGLVAMQRDLGSSDEARARVKRLRNELAELKGRLNEHQGNGAELRDLLQRKKDKTGKPGQDARQLHALDQQIAFVRKQLLNAQDLIGPVSVEAARIEQRLAALESEIDHAQGRQKNARGASDAMNKLPDVGSQSVGIDRTGKPTTRATASSDSATAWDQRVTDVRNRKDAGQSGGVTEDELRAMGLSEKSAAEALESMRKWTNLGMSSAQQVEEVLSRYNRVPEAMRGSNGAFARQLGVVDSGRQQQRAAQLGNALVRRLSGDDEMLLADAVSKDDGKRAKFAQAMKHGLVGAAGKLLLRRQAKPHSLTTTAGKYAAEEEKLRKSIADLHAQQAAREAAHFQIRLRKRGLNPEEQLRLDQLCKDYPDLAAPGMAEAMRQPQYLRDLDDRIAATHGGIGKVLGEMDKFLAARRAERGGDAAQALDATILAAILAHLGATPPEDFRPADHKDAIEATLKEWGVPVDNVAPEIHHILSQTFGPRELNDWVRKLKVTRSEGLVKDADASPAESVRVPVVQREVLEQLDAAMKAMNDDTVFRVTRGTRVDVQSGAIPLEPTATLALNLRGQFGTFAGIDIARRYGHYEIVVREGKDGKGGADLLLKLWGASALGAKVTANLASPEAGGSRMRGMVVSFPIANGHTAPRDFVVKLLSGQAITDEDIQKAASVRPLAEARGAVKATVGPKVTIDAFAGPGAGDMGPYFGVNANAAAQASGAVTYSHVTSNSTSLWVTKNTRIVAGEASGGVSAGVRVGAPAQGKSVYAAGTDVADLSVTGSVEDRTVEYQVRNSDALTHCGWHRLTQVVAPAGPAKQWRIDRAGGPAFTELLERMEAGTDEQKAKAAEVRNMIARAGANETVSFTRYSDPRIRHAVNEMLSTAKALRAGRVYAQSPKAARRQARELERKAARMMADDRSYILQSVQVIATSEMVDTQVHVNAVVARLSSYTEDKGDFYKGEVMFDADLAREVHDKVHARA